MLCHTYDLGRRCQNPTRLGSNHCAIHDPEELTPNSPNSPNSPSSPELPAELTHDDELTGTHEEHEFLRVELVEISELGPDKLRPLALHPCHLPGECAVCEQGGMRQCHTSIYDSLCGFPARAERAWCINHDPEYRLQRREFARKGGRNSVAARRTREPLSSLALNLGTRAGIQAAVDLIIRLELLGQISPARSRNVLRALAVAARNFDRDPRQPATQDMDEYLELREHIDTFIPETLAQARQLDLAFNSRNKQRAPTPSYPSSPHATAARVLSHLTDLFD